MLIVLVVTNILSHVHTLTPFGNHLTCMGVIFGSTMGANVLTYILRSSNVVLCKPKLFVCSSGGGPARDSNTQVKTLFHSSVSKKGLVTYLWLFSSLLFYPGLNSDSLHSSVIPGLAFPRDSLKFINYS